MSPGFKANLFLKDERHAKRKYRWMCYFTIAALSALLAVSTVSLLKGDGIKKPEKIPIFNALNGRVEEVEKIYKTDYEWRKILTPEQYRITRLKGTEKPYSQQCIIPSEGEKYVYQCISCGTDLFRVEKKFESGTGWPSFMEPVSELNIRTQTDNSFGMRSTEVLCARCDAHLGHVFDDGPPPAGKRYCINSAALKSVKIARDVKQVGKATFAAGCFWGVEERFRQVKGVVYTAAGYMGGTLKNPTYEDVSRGKTGHMEVVYLEYDPDRVSYEKLLNVFWSMHDPTTPGRQGPDVGSQYHSAIFYYTEQQKKAALLSKNEIEQSGKFKNPVVTRIIPAQTFYRAEEYHQCYYEKQGKGHTTR